MQFEELLKQTTAGPAPRKSFEPALAADRPNELLLMRQMELLAHILNAIPDPIFVKDQDHRWRLLNDSFCRFMKRERDELIGRSDYDFFPKEQADVFWEKDNECFQSGAEIVNEEMFTTAEGEERIISTKKSVFRDPQTGKLLLVGVIRDVTETKIAEKRLGEALEQLRGLSNSDELTQLANRRHFLALAQHQARVAARTGQGILLIFADMDNLKVINDQLGHPAGDAAIVEMAEIMRHVFRDSDVIARVGGDEFVVLMSGVEPTGAEIALERLRDTLRQRNACKTTPYDLMMSLGTAYSHPSQPLPISMLLEIADSAMYREKRGRKCR